MKANGMKANGMDLTPAAPVAVMWFRRDLRLEDNAALHHALQWAQARGGRCLALFCFDTTILDALPGQNPSHEAVSHDAVSGAALRVDSRVSFIWESVRALDEALRALGSGLLVRHGAACAVLAELIDRLSAQGPCAIFANHDYEPAAQRRDEAVRAHALLKGAHFESFKDHVLFEKSEVLTQAGTPHRVYSAYKRAWYQKLHEARELYLAPYATTEREGAALLPSAALPVSDDWSTAAAIGFAVRAPSLEPEWRGGSAAGLQVWQDFLTRIHRYAALRDYPAQIGTSGLSVHLRFGTLSVRRLLREALALGGEGAGKWSDELVWREFYNAILHHFPHTVAAPFKPQFAHVEWDDPARDSGAALRFAAWQKGLTGYPIVDAAMRQLTCTGLMHNRLRMVVASFLTKQLHIDWRAGERHFAAWLMDYDLSQNVGNWQWAASVGADAQPYFRIFNPLTQSEKFDAAGDFIRHYCPELAGFDARWIHQPASAPPLIQRAAGCVVGKDYPAPIVEHARERAEALRRFKSVGLTAPEELNE